MLFSFCLLFLWLKTLSSLSRKTLEMECLLRFFYYLFLLLSFSTPSSAWRRFWVNVVVSCGIRVASHRICASRRSVQHCLRSVLLPNFDCIFSSFLTVCWSSVSFFYIFLGGQIVAALLISCAALSSLTFRSKVLMI